MLYHPLLDYIRVQRCPYASQGVSWNLGKESVFLEIERDSNLEPRASDFDLLGKFSGKIVLACKCGFHGSDTAEWIKVESNICLNGSICHASQ